MGEERPRMRAAHRAAAAGDEADLAAVRVLEHVRAVQPGHRHVAKRLVAAVAELKGDAGAGRDADDLTRPEFALGVPFAKRRRSGENPEHLLVDMMEMARPSGLAGRHLGQGHADLTRAEGSADGTEPCLEPLAVPVSTRMRRIDDIAPVRALAVVVRQTGENGCEIGPLGQLELAADHVAEHRAAYGHTLDIDLGRQILGFRMHGVLPWLVMLRS